MEEQRAVLLIGVKAGGRQLLCGICALQVIVDNFGIEFILVWDALVRLGVQIQDGDGECKTRFCRLDF